MKRTMTALLLATAAAVSAQGACRTGCGSALTERTRKCSMTGDPHMRKFDSTKYDWMARGTYQLFKASTFCECVRAHSGVTRTQWPRQHPALPCHTDSSPPRPFPCSRNS